MSSTAKVLKFPTLVNAKNSCNRSRWASVVQRCAAGVLLLLLLQNTAAAEERSPASGLSSNTAAHINAGLQQLYNLDFNRAETAFAAAVQTASNHPAGYVYLALSGLARIMVDGESSQTTAAVEHYIREANEKALKRVLRSQDPWDRYFAGSAFLLRACWEGRQERYIDALQWLKRAMVQIDKARYDIRTRADAQVLVGTYQYFMSRTPWSVRFFAALLIESTDRQEGIENLETGMREARFTGPEARMLLVTVYLWEDELERAHEYIEDLVEQFPENVLLYNFRKQLLLEERRIDEALAVATNNLARVAGSTRLRGLLPDMQYDAGVLYMYHTNYTAAGKLFSDAYISASNKPAIRAWTALRAGTVNDLQARRDNACRWYRAALEQPQSTDLVRYYAREFLHKPYRGGSLE